MTLSCADLLWLSRLHTLVVVRRYIKEPIRVISESVLQREEEHELQRPIRVGANYIGRVREGLLRHPQAEITPHLCAISPMGFNTG